MTEFEHLPFDEQLAELVTGLLTTFDEAQDAARYSVIVVMRPMLLMFLGHQDEAMAAAHRMAADPDRWTRAFSRLCVCFVAENNGDADTSAEALTEALDALREIGERWALCLALGMDGTLRSLRGDYDGAIRSHEEALAKAAELGSGDDALQQRAQLGRVRMLSGDLAGADRDFQLVLGATDESNGVDRADIQFYVGCCMVRLQCIVGDLAEARKHLDQTRAYRTSVPMAQRGHRMAVLMAAESNINEASGDLDAAGVNLAEALRYAVLSKDMPLVATVGERIARILMLAGDRTSAAAGVLGACARLRGALDQGDPDVRDTIDRLVDQLGEDGYAKAFRMGRELDRDGAIRCLHAALGAKQDEP